MLQPKNNKAPQAKMPASGKSLSEIDKVHDGAEAAPGRNGRKLSELDEQVERASDNFKRNKQILRGADDFEKEAERATKDQLIGGFNFNYEYMGGENYIQDDLKEIQAQRQPGVDKLKRGLNRFAGEFVLNVLETPGILGGAAVAAVTGDINQMTDNFWVRAAESMKEHLHESNQVYSSKHVREGGVWDKMSSGEWIATEGASALAFMASALVPGLAVSKGAKALKLTQMMAKGGKGSQSALRLFDKAAAKIGKVTGGASDEALSTLGKATGNLGEHITTTMTNTVFEAGIEAMGAQHSFLANLDARYTSGEITLEQYNELKPAADKAAASVFRWNFALLTGPNMKMTSMMLGPTAHTLQKAHKNISRSGASKWIKGGGKEATTKAGKFLKSAPVTAVGKMGKGFASNTLREGVVEEMGQMTIEKFHTDEYLDALISGEDKRNWAETYAEVAGSTDGQVAALTGGLISGPMSMRQRYLEGKKLRKDVDELVNNYNGVDNYYAAVRKDIYETDKDGNMVMHRVNEKGEPVEEGGKLVPKIDQTKIANIADAKEETDRLFSLQQEFMEQGREDEAAAISARLQAAAFGVYLQTGPDGLKALEEMMLESPATKSAVDQYNKEHSANMTVSEYVKNEMDKANAMAKDYQFYERNVSAPLTRKWERKNKVQPGTPEGDAAMAQRARFEQNYRQSYTEAGAVERELETRLSDAQTNLARMKEAKRSEELITKEEARVKKLDDMFEKAVVARQELEKSENLDKRWDAFYKSGLKAQAINDGKMVYDLDKVISRVKDAKTPDDIKAVVKAAVEEGLLLPSVDKDKLPEQLDKMATGTDLSDILAALTIYSAHDNVTKEDNAKISAYFARQYKSATTRAEDLEAFKAIAQSLEAAQSAQQEEADFKENETVDTEGGEFPEEGGDTTETEEFPPEPGTQPEVKPETYRGIPVEDTEDITNAEGKKGAAQFDKGGIKVNRKMLKKFYEDKKWTNPRELVRMIHGQKEVSTMTPLPAYIFQSYEQFEQFVLEHEYQHSVLKSNDFYEEFPGATKGQYEDAINRLALEALDIKVPNSLKSPHELISAVEVNRPAKPESDDSTFLWLTEGVPLEQYYDTLTELAVRFRDQRHTVADIDHLYLAIKQNTQLADAIQAIAPMYSQEILKRGTVIANESWAEYVNGKEVTEQEITDAKVDTIDAGYDVPQGVRDELVKIIEKQREKIKARELQNRIEAFNAILAEKQRLWTDLKLKDSLIKAGSTVYWKGLGGKHYSGTVRSIIKGTDDNGTNVLIEDTKGNLHVVNAAGLHSTSLDVAGINDSQKAKHAAKADKEKKEIEKGKVAYSRVGVRSDTHPTVVENGEVKGSHPTIKDKFVDIYNAFLRYLEEPRNKSKDVIEFAFQQEFLRANVAKGNHPNHEVLVKVEKVWNKVKSGGALTDAETDLLIDHMPIALRAHRSAGHGSAGAHLRTSLGKEDQEFQRVERPLRAKIIGEWILAGGKLDGHKMQGVSANWGFQYTGDVNTDSEAGPTGNFVHKLKGITLKNMKLFTVGSVVSNEIINKDGSRTKVPADLRDKVGGIYINVKDNNGKTFPLRLKTNTLKDTPELKVIMDLLDAIMVGNAKMNDPIPGEIEQFMEENMPELSKVFKETPTVGVLYNTLVYKGGDASQLGTTIDPLTRTLSIGQDMWDAQSFKENKDVIEGMLGLKFRNINFPSNDQTKNKLPSTSNMDYLTYIMETKAVSTNVKQDAPIFVGKPDPNNPNYMGGINPYLSPNEVKGEKAPSKKGSTVVKRAGTIAQKKATTLGSRAVSKLRKAGYTPTDLSQKALDFIASVAKKRGNAFTQALEDYNNRIISENEENAQDHVIKKCKG